MRNVEDLTKEELLELIKIYGKNWLALDGVWFQSVERKYGMDEAVFHDAEAWKRYTVIEAKRIKEFCKMPEHPGMDGLEQAFRLRIYANINPFSVERVGENKLVMKVTDCRVQTARNRKQMELHPCKSVGIIEHKGFAKTIDSRITCRCLSCPPEVTDPSCACVWEFTLNEA